MPARDVELTQEQLDEEEKRRAMREYQQNLMQQRAARQAQIEAYRASPKGIEEARIAARNQVATGRRESLQNSVAPGNIWQRLAQLLGQ